MRANVRGKAGPRRTAEVRTGPKEVERQGGQSNAPRSLGSAAQLVAGRMAALSYSGGLDNRRTFFVGQSTSRLCILQGGGADKPIVADGQSAVGESGRPACQFQPLNAASECGSVLPVFKRR